MDAASLSHPGFGAARYAIHGRLPLSHPGFGFPSREGEPPSSDAQKPLGFEA